MTVTVLVVEDDVGVATMLARAVKRAGYSPTTCATIASAKLELTRSEPGIVILDLRLGSQDGRELLPCIPLDVHVIILSGTSIDSRAGLESPRIQHLEKPVSSHDLRVALTRARPPQLADTTR